MRRRSEDTKALILAAARERFAADGYDRATIRAIAADAGIDPSMVMRYFGTKERLFAAAAEFDLELPDLTSVPGDDVGATLVAHFLDRWERDETLVILLRTAVTNEAVAERMRSIFSAQLVPVAAKISGDHAAARKRAALAASQILGMALCRYVLALPSLGTMTRQELVDWLGPVVQRYVASPA
ncbi:TetR family transcriptional regulator [Microbispora sp. NPDC088329]|uniref:TetR/AcrR family transcriptional regulator n=1 Tax=Microbispora sp. NPDC088329 TaxID=3154869 RepID=UPI003444088F